MCIEKQAILVPELYRKQFLEWVGWDCTHACMRMEDRHQADFSLSKRQISTFTLRAKSATTAER